MTFLLLVHAFATLCMVGLIWFVQLVHYPLFARVGSGFDRYEADHVRRTGWIVGPLMLAEVATALLLLAWSPGAATAAGAALLAIVWTSTACLQMPAHRRLERGFDAAAHGKLVATNWLRTAAWTARGALALGMLLP